MSHVASSVTAHSSDREDPATDQGAESAIAEDDDWNELMLETEPELKTEPPKSYLLQPTVSKIALFSS